MIQRRGRSAIGILLVVAAASSLAGCGRRGPLLPPPGTPESQASATLPPETQSDYYETGGPNYADGPISTGPQPLNPPSQQAKAKKPATPQAPKNSTFFLDPLL